MTTNRFLNYLFGESHVTNGSGTRENFQRIMDRIYETSLDYLITDDTKEWKAICLSGEKYEGAGVVPGESAKEITVNAGNSKGTYYDVRIHRVGVDDKCLKNPFGPDIKDAQEQSDWIKMHEYARSAESLDKPPVFASILIVREDITGRLTFTPTDRRVDDLMLNQFKGEENKFGNNPQTMGDYAAAEAPIISDNPTAEQFALKLRASPFFSGFSGPALAGVMANAQAESAYKSGAKGDHKSYYNSDAVSARRKKNVEERNINGYCSWGYWQLNICPNDGDGYLLANKKGIDLTTTEGKDRWINEVVNDEEAQFAHVAMRLQEIGLNIRTTSAYDFGDKMTTEFERPADKENKGRQRGTLSNSLYNKYKNILDLSPQDAMTELLTRELS